MVCGAVDYRRVLSRARQPVYRGASCENHLGVRLGVSAHDPSLLVWVQATLVGSYLLTFALFVGPLTTDEKDKYCMEAAQMDRWLGLPVGTLSVTSAGLAAFLEEMDQQGSLAAWWTVVCTAGLSWPANDEWVIGAANPCSRWFPLAPEARIPNCAVPPCPFQPCGGPHRGHSVSGRRPDVRAGVSAPWSQG